MLTKYFLSILVVFAIPSITIAKCNEALEIDSGKYYWMVAENKVDFCYKQYVVKGKLTVVTLKHIEGRADFDVRAYKKSSFEKLVSSGTASGAKTEVFTLPVSSYSGYVYFRVNNYSDSYGKYELYVDQLNFEELFVEAFALTSVEYMAEVVLKSLFGIDDSSSSSTKRNANRAAIALVSNLQGKSLSEISKNSIINELRREYVGNGFLPSLMVNFGVTLVERIYFRA